MFLLQIEPPTTDDPLLNWALGVLVVVIGAAFFYLINQIASNQKALKEKDNLLIDLTKDLSSRNERSAELIKEFTMVLIDHSKKLEAVADLLISANQKSFEGFKTDIRSTIQEYVIKSNESKN